MNCPFCHKQLLKDGDGYYTCYTDNCPSMSAGGVGPSGSDSLWLKLSQLQDEITYRKGLNCPTVVEKQMQTITELSKQLTAAQKALKAIHDALGLGKSDEELDKMMILPTGLHIIKRIVNQGLVDGKKVQPEKD